MGDALDDFMANGGVAAVAGAAASAAATVAASRDVAHRALTATRRDRPPSLGLDDPNLDLTDPDPESKRASLARSRRQTVLAASLSAGQPVCLLPALVPPALVLPAPVLPAPRQAAVLS
jgi:hypothetical protein